MGLFFLLPPTYSRLLSCRTHTLSLLRVVMFPRKSYIVFDLGRRSCTNINSTKGLRKAADGSTLGNKKGVFFRFYADRVVVFGSVGDGGLLSFADVDETVARVVGSVVRGKVVVQVYHTSFPGMCSKVQQALLHNRIAKNPPIGLLKSTLDYQVSDKLVLKLSPFRDGFVLNIRIDCKGFAEIMCDARPCKGALDSSVFHRRCVAVMQTIQNIK